MACIRILGVGKGGLPPLSLIKQFQLGRGQAHLPDP